MTLPDKDIAWPPASAHAQKLAEWSAWYAGDPDQLTGLYGPITGPVVRSSQYAGGVVGRIARWFWGVPTPAGEQRTKLHVPLAADICATSADLLYSEPVRLTSSHEGTAAVLADLQEQGLDARLHEGAEVAAAMGGEYLRTVWDQAVSPLPWTEVAHPDGAVPKFRNGRLVQVTLWTELDQLEDGVTHRLLERHEAGVIEYGLYAGTNSRLGKRVPLQDHPDAAGYAELVNEDGLQLTGLSRIAVAYAPNMLPNRLDRRSDQGRSDLQGVEPWLDALDEAYSSWWRDIRHGKARLHVPAQYLESNGPGEGASANLDREVYVPVAGVLATGKDGLQIDAQQFAIRVNEHLQTCQAWTERIIESAGYSTQSLAGDTGGAVTATEVRSHERRSYMTRGKKVRYQSHALRHHLAVQLEVAKMLGHDVTPDDFTVEFADGVQEQPLQLAQTIQALRVAQAASVETVVKMLNPEWEQTEVDAEVGKIMAESRGEPVSVPDDAGL